MPTFENNFTPQQKHYQKKCEYCNAEYFTQRKQTKFCTSLCKQNAYLDRKRGIEVKPLISGGTGIDSFNPQMPEAYPEHLEAGTQNLAGIAALNTGVQYVLSHQKAIVEKEHFLLQKLYEGLTGDVEFYSSLENSTPIVALNIPGKDSAYVSDLLNYKYGIVTRCGAHCAPLMHKHLKTEERGIVRLSISFQNTIEDIDFVVRAIQKISNDY